MTYLQGKNAFLQSLAFCQTVDSVEIKQSRLIASVRIKVENAIKRMKEFKVFSSTLSNRTNKKQVDDMMVIVCALCNLKPKLRNNS